MPSTIYLINMPYSSITLPSLALGLIENYINKYGHQVETIYGNVEFSTKLGLELYAQIDNSFFEHLIGEWTFSRIAFPEKKLNDEGFFALFTDLSDTIKKQLLSTRDKAENYIHELANRLLAQSPKIVACTSTFQQNCASLALLRVIKEKNHSVITMMGGANCEGIMGQTISESFSWVDYIFSGECDDVIGKFIDKLMKDEFIGAHNLPHGFICQRNEDLLLSQNELSAKPPRGYIEDMAQVGTPIYDSYFSTLNDLQLTEKIKPGLLAETSRGCWWGAKKHCTFCGLNGASMTHRAKSSEAVLAEFQELHQKYKINKLEIVDNILPMEYMKTVLPALSKEKKYNIFYETKSNLKKEHVAQLAEAGVKWIQPGFESLHDDFLKLVAKGATGIQNISALKWCLNFGVRVSWNLLCGAPNEKAHWYEEMAEIIPLIVHLQPPHHELIKIRYPRFSPYFKDPEKYGLTLAPLQSYQHVYPLTGQALANIAYFFDEKSTKEKDVFSLSVGNVHEVAGHKLLQEQVTQWSQQWSSSAAPLLYMSDQDESIVVIDTRKVATSFTHQLTGLTAVIYRLCEEPVSKSRLVNKLIKLGLSSDKIEVNEALEILVKNKLLLSLSNCYLALALKGPAPALPETKDYPAGYLNFNGN
ncbi:MAG: RiPP maturation radical SAM protein 1 [Colwellia sp.]|nr:RiPP maturation radical SAM protein 1 [Colwellia sp.]